MPMVISGGREVGTVGNKPPGSLAAASCSAAHREDASNRKFPPRQEPDTETVVRAIDQIAVRTREVAFHRLSAAPT